MPPHMLDNATKEFIAAHRTEDPRTLALQAKRYPNVDIREAVVQIEGWQLSREKLPAWAATEGITYPPRISMEQCSSEATATYKASLAHGSNIADLTGGFGIDSTDLANTANDTYLKTSGEKSGIGSYSEVCDLLVNWHIQEVVLPSIAVEENHFDPYDKTQVDVTDIR